MKTIRRYDGHLVPQDDGGWVSYDDHAAVLDYKLSEASKELAGVLERLYRAEKDRDSLTASIISACTGSGCLNPHELRAALDRTHKRATNAEKENAVLRAECDAWREFEAEAEERSWSKAWPVHADWIADAQNATDAAGALKGVE